MYIVYNNNHVTQKDVQMYFQRPRPRSFDSHVKLCTYPGLNMVQEGQTILKDQWAKWDIVTIAENEATDYQGIQFDIVSINSESTIAYDKDADMILDHDIVECESVQSESVPEW